MLYNSSLVRWLQRKRYQFEVTVPVYMMTPTEAVIFHSIVFLFVSLIVIAAALYLPEHLSTIAHRASFYWAGEDAQLHDTVLADKFVGETVGRIVEEL